jgi:hypothetical protein
MSHATLDSRGETLVYGNAQGLSPTRTSRASQPLEEPLYPSEWVYNPTARRDIYVSISVNLSLTDTTIALEAIAQVRPTHTVPLLRDYIGPTIDNQPSK